MSELKPCPFCGGTPTFDTRDYRGGPGSYNWVYCRTCNCRTPTLPEKNCIEAWNRRSDIPYLPPELVDMIRAWPCPNRCQGGAYMQQCAPFNDYEEVPCQFCDERARILSAVTQKEKGDA